MDYDGKFKGDVIRNSLAPKELDDMKGFIESYVYVIQKK